jgi:uncharacterized membrane protein
MYETPYLVYSFLESHPKIYKAKIAKKLRLSRPTVHKALKILGGEGKIEYERVEYRIYVRLRQKN